MLAVVPMGWNWGLHFCQSVVNQAMSEVGITPSQRVEDGSVSPLLMDNNACIGAGYVDNFAVMSQDPRKAEELRDAISQNLRNKGLPVHSEGPASLKSTFTGLEFDVETGILRVRPDRLIRLRQGILAVLRRGALNGPDMLGLIGHITWAMISRRETFAMVSALYAFARQTGKRAIRLWSGVAKELQWIAATLPLWAVNLQQAWWPIASCSDASPYGRGVTVRRLDERSLQSLGATAEK